MSKKNDLERRIDTLLHPDQQAHNKNSKGREFGMIFSYCIDFFSCVFTGAIIGYILDIVIETCYICTIAWFLLGVVAGVCNVLKKYRHF